MNFPHAICTSLIVSMLIVIVGCGKDGDGGTEAPSKPEISSISPTTGPVGTAVTIKGSGFSTSISQNAVTFNGTPADVSSASSNELKTNVPQGATTGPVEVKVAGETDIGPTFTVEETMPGITSIEPDSGAVGTQVIITGKNFSATPSENTVTFNGIEAAVSSASEGEVVTAVPDGAASGPVAVTVNGKTATGPEFKILTKGKLKVMIATLVGDDPAYLDPDGYILLIDGVAYGTIGANVTVDSLFVEALEQGNHTVELTDPAFNCFILNDEDLGFTNPQDVDIIAANTTNAAFFATCIQYLDDQIAFSTDRDGNNEIYVMSDSGNYPTRLTDSTATDIQPAVGPDGMVYAFSRDGDIFVGAVDQSLGYIAESYTNTGNNARPSWAPDGSRIAFETDRDGNVEVYVLDIETKDVTNITNNSADDANPAWSPDGSKIAFASNRDGGAEIYTIAPDGTGLVQLTDNASNDLAPAWSPDGSKIAFASDRDGNMEIYVMNADGTGQYRLTNNAGLDMHPSWSPGGSHITFFSERDGNREIYKVIANSGGGLVNLSNNSAADFDPSWSPPLPDKFKTKKIPIELKKKLINAASDRVHKF